MIKCTEIGKIYDSLFFCIEYFNEAAVNDTIINCYDDSDFMVKCYQDINKKIPVLPPILEPFFLCQNQKPSPMTEFFTDQIDFMNDSLESFLRKIVSNSNFLLSLIVKSIFPDNQDSDNRTHSLHTSSKLNVEALINSNYSAEFQLQIALLFGDFDYAISTLISQLQLIYIQVDLLHQKHAEKLDSEFKQIKSAQNIQLYENLCSIKIANNFEKTLVAISLLNQYITKIVARNRNLELLLGFRHEEDLLLLYNESNIDIQQFLIAIGNDTRLSIIQTLQKHEELTCSTISRLLDFPPTTTLRHLDVLYDCGIVYISKRSGLNIFYCINYDLLDKATALIRHQFRRVNK